MARIRKKKPEKEPSRGRYPSNPPKDIPEWPDYVIQTEVGEPTIGYYAWSRRGGLTTGTGRCATEAKALKQLSEGIPKPSRHGLLPQDLIDYAEHAERRKEEIEVRGIDLRLTADDIKIICQSLSVNLTRLCGVDCPESRRRERGRFISNARELHHELLKKIPDFEEYKGFKTDPCPDFLQEPRVVDWVDESGEPHDKELRALNKRLIREQGCKPGFEY